MLSMVFLTLKRTAKTLDRSDCSLIKFTLSDGFSPNSIVYVIVIDGVSGNPLMPFGYSYDSAFLMHKNLDKSLYLGASVTFLSDKVFKVSHS